MERNLGRVQGLSAYEIATQKGFEGTEEEWIASLKGEAFTFEDFTQEQLIDLKGEKGDKGEIAYSDVVDNLESLETQKPLSANQGRILNGLFDKVNNKKVDYYLIDEGYSENDIQKIFNIEKAKIIEFKDGEYLFTKTFILNKNTTLILNNAHLKFNIPSITENYTKSHGFFNFKPDDEFIGYNGNGNITFIGGNIEGGNCSFCHASNIIFNNVNFFNCKNDHILELAGINNLVVNSCKFMGQISSNNYSEYIQIDSMNKLAFPHFTNENNSTYDNTINQNWTISNCEFMPPSNKNYHFYNAIGNHGVTGELLHKNITVQNCVFKNTENMSMQIMNVDNFVIRNNSFISNIVGKGANEGTHIRFRNINKNVLIYKNTFIANYRAIQMSSPQQENHNFKILYNEFSGYNDSENYSNEPILDMNSPSSLTIADNNFYDFKQNAIRINDSSSESLIPTVISNHYYIHNNNFISENSVSDIIKPYYGIPHVYNNNFEVSASVRCIVMTDDGSLKNCYFYNNVCNHKEKLLSFNNIANFNIFDCYVTAFQGSEAIIHEKLPNANLFNFNKIILVVGHADNTEILLVKSLYPATNIGARTWRFPVVNNDNTTISNVIFTINANGTFSYNNNGSNLSLRGVYCYSDIQ